MIEQIIQNIVNLIPTENPIMLVIAVSIKMLLQAVLCSLAILIPIFIGWMMFSIILIQVTGDKRATYKLVRRIKRRLHYIFSQL